MVQLTLEEIKQYEFEALKYFKTVCEKYGLKYFLSNGTLLGAVKYKGFIPWDDDIDLMMPREDYNKLVLIFKDSDRYSLLSSERTSGLYIPFAKLTDLNTVKEENLGDGVLHGLDIDIFPLDYWYGDKKTAVAQCKKQYKSVHTLILANSYKPKGLNLRELAKCAVKTFGRLIGRKRICDNIIKTAVSGNFGSHQYMGCVSWCIYGEKEIVPAECFNGTTQIEFENEIFSAPSGYDVYLRSLYGDYEKDPPISEQKTHHIFKAYRK